MMVSIINLNDHSQLLGLTIDKISRGPMSLTGVKPFSPAECVVDQHMIFSNLKRYRIIGIFDYIGQLCYGTTHFASLRTACISKLHIESTAG